MRTLRFASRLLAAPLAVLATSTVALAHVPYLERRDLGPIAAFDVKDVDQSIVIYAWLETPDDIDYYRFEVTEPMKVHLESIVPVCPGYEEVKPSFAILGPGLPPPNGALPFELPEGWGGVIFPDVAPGEERDSFFEPFGGKSYYEGPIADYALPVGSYYAIYWEPNGNVGDYGAVIGLDERFGLVDILRSIIVTPIIRDDGELHVPCD